MGDKLQSALSAVQSSNSELGPAVEAAQAAQGASRVAAVCVNAEHLMAALPESCVDVLFSDSPYNRGVNSEWDAPGHDGFVEQINKWAGLYVRVLAEKGIGVAFTDPQYVSYWIAAFRNLGLTAVEPLIWYKPDASWRHAWDYKGQQTEDFTKEPQALRDCVECGVIFRKSVTPPVGRDKLTEVAVSEGISEGESGNVWRIGKCKGDERLKNDEQGILHPAQKPEAVVAPFLLARQDLEEVLVLDPFAGVGPVAVTAAKLNRDEFKANPKYSVICSDLDETWINTIRERLERVRTKKGGFEAKPRNTVRKAKNTGGWKLKGSGGCLIM